MLDKLLIRKFNKGRKEALRSIYELYKDDMLGLAIALLNNSSSAEDVTHDVFVRFAQKAGRFELKGSLKAYLLTSVANAVRDRYRAKSTRDVALDQINDFVHENIEPVAEMVLGEESVKLNDALGQLKYEQREAIVLHLHENMKFRQIAELQSVSTNTAQSRYRYGLDKLRSILNRELQK
jgi:RNA polymerase sigma-70 factor (ECF subfamily)